MPGVPRELIAVLTVLFSPYDENPAGVFDYLRRSESKRSSHNVVVTVLLYSLHGYLNTVYNSAVSLLEA
jgi:hypothetical protein